MDIQFSDADRQRIRDAVAAAETQTSGEIVPFIMPRSGRYEVAIWKGGVLMTLLALALAALTLFFYSGWGMGWLYTGWGVAVLVLAAGAAGALLTAFIPVLRRQLAGEARLARTVHHRAMRAFVEEEVFDTRDRTGILLFVSLFEHRIEVLGDAGINQAVVPDDWAEVVDRLRTGISSGRLVDGLVDAIGLCGELLHTKGVAIQPDDTDELSNDVRIRSDD